MSRTAARASVLEAPNFDALRDALSETLRARGVIDAVRSTLRAEVYNALEDHEAQASAPTPAPETTLLNALGERKGVTCCLSLVLSFFFPVLLPWNRVAGGKWGREKILG